MRFALLALLFAGCAAKPPRQAPGASTAAVSQRVTSARGSVTSAQASATKAQGNVASARGRADRIGDHLDTIHYDGKQILRILGHP